MNPSSRPVLADAALALLLLASLQGFLGIPFLGFGLDLQNLYAFHQCAFRNDPYSVAGAACGDPLGRDMVYPPPLYWLFVWLRPLTHQGAVFVWTAIVAVGTAVSLLPFAPAARWRGDGRFGLFAGLLLATYPVLFAIERANNDVVVLVAWAGAVLAWRSGRHAVAGALVGLSVALKLYPAFGAVVVGAGAIAGAIARKESRGALFRFAAAGVAAAILPYLPLLGQARTWWTTRLAVFAELVSTPSHFGHALATVMADPRLLQGLLLVAWLWAAVRTLARDPALVLAGALAISTSFAKTSFDYNLLTALPLLLVLHQRGGEGRWRPWVDGLLALGLVTIAGNRLIWALAPGIVEARLYLLWAFLAAVGVLAPWIGPTGAAAASAVAPAADAGPAPEARGA